MTIPSILLGIILSTIYGALFHLWRGGNAGRLLLYLILAWIGFWMGQIIGSVLHITFDVYGQVHLAIATLGSLIFLFAGYWLSLVQVERKPN